MPELLDGPQPAASKPRECRVFERFSCQLPTTLQPTSGWGKVESQWNGTITDVSLGGLCLVLRRRFERGTSLTIELPEIEGQPAYSVVARVVHIRPAATNCWMLGCQFVSTLTEDELHRLLPVVSRRAPAVPTESRVLRNVRFRLLGEKGTLLQWIIQRLEVTQCKGLLPGSLLTMSVRTAPVVIPTFKLRVVEFVMQEDQWTVLARLPGPPSPELLAAFAQAREKAPVPPSQVASPPEPQE
jgi:PilZ domain